MRALFLRNFSHLIGVKATVSKFTYKIYGLSRYRHCVYKWDNWDVRISL